MNSFYIAWRYLGFNRLRTVTLVACITLIAVLPLTLEVLLAESERQLVARAESTPLVVGARGSALDLIMNSLYFGDEMPETVDMTAADRVDESGLATAVPVYARFKAQGYRIVGTSLGYFAFRDLRITAGRQLALLGECVLGATTAKELGLGPGDSLVSSPETLFDLAGVYPLKMKVVGILKRSFTADDLAIFVDLRTAWVIAGLGHGHQDLVTTSDDSVILDRDGDNIVANAKLMQYTEITDANRDSFHFHASRDALPVSAVIAVPEDARAGTILRGRYLGEAEQQQIIDPNAVIGGLMENIFRIKNVLDAVVLVVGSGTVLALVLVFSLSIRLRQRELDTIFKLGCGRLTVVSLLAAEIAIILAISGFVSMALVYVVGWIADDLVRLLFIR
jgi:putative ABC transport system permease protein